MKTQIAGTALPIEAVLPLKEANILSSSLSNHSNNFFTNSTGLNSRFCLKLERTELKLMGEHCKVTSMAMKGT